MIIKTPSITTRLTVITLIFFIKTAALAQSPPVIVNDNISIRHAKKDPGAVLAWANTDVFAFVIYYKQGPNKPTKIKW